MKILRGMGLGVVTLLAAAMGWGAWFSATHAALDINVNDRAQTDAGLYGTAPGVTVEFLDEDGKLLAPTRNAERGGYALAQHPGFGDCTPYEGRDHRKYAECFEEYGAWISGWAMRTRYARVKAGDCVIARVPVTPTRDGGDWAKWWFPIQHGAGKPYAWIQLHVQVDSGACAAVA